MIDLSIETADKPQLWFDGSDKEPKDTLDDPEETQTRQIYDWMIYGNRTSEDFEGELPDEDEVYRMFENEYNIWWNQ